MEYVTAVARCKYQGHEIHVSVTDDEAQAWHYRGPGGTYTLELIWTYEGFEVLLFQVTEGTKYRFSVKFRPSSWDEGRALAIELAAGVREWEE